MLRTTLRASVALVLGLVALALLPAPAAQAAIPTGPSAVAVSSNGITYVGFAAGGSLTRIDASGAVLSPIPLPRSGPLDGIAVDAADNIWVSYQAGVSRISPTGAELTFFDTDPSGCPAADNGGQGDPSLFGGIAVSPTSVYVAQRCAQTLTQYSLTGAKISEVDVPGGARGVAYGVAQNNQPAKVYVASPTTGKVLVFPAQLTPVPAPPQPPVGGYALFTLTVPQSGSATPRPSGVTVDRYGQLAVADAANDRVLLFDTNNVNGPGSYSWYRTLGRPGANAGDLSNPTAITQYPVDGPLQDRRGDFFVADTGNGRVQRWNTSGYTYWSAPVGGGGTGPAPTAPVSLTRPTVGGTPAVGQTLTCSQGTWSGSPTSFQYGWNRNGAAITGQTSQQYVVQPGDAGQGISCFVRATNAAGTSDFATSDAVAISAGPSAPANTAAPVISGTAEQGSTLSCSQGSWTGSPTSYAVAWLRNGSQVATGPSYVVQAADVGQAITCRVTATNAAGSSQATSAPVTPTAPVTCAGVVETLSINGGAAYTNTQAVTLKAVPPAGATQLLLSNDGGFANAAPQALTGSCSYAWSLSTVGGKATRTVYVRFLNGSGAVVGRASDDIVLDAGGPAVARATVTKAGRQYVVRVPATDRVSGVARLQHAATRGAKGTTVRYQPRLTTRTPARFTWVRVLDRAGNASAWVRTVRR